MEGIPSLFLRLFDHCMFINNTLINTVYTNISITSSVVNMLIPEHSVSDELELFKTVFSYKKIKSNWHFFYIVPIASYETCTKNWLPSFLGQTCF